jgi:putative molybdopterin biosynthesis protein
MVVNHLSKLRKGLGFGATELARAAGVSRQAIHAIESGAFVPNTAVALRLAAVLGVSVEELFSIEDPVSESARRIRAEIFPGPAPARSPLVRLCQVGERTLAVPAEAEESHLPDSDGIALSRSAKGAVDVELWGDWKPGRQLLIAGCDPAVTVLRQGLTAAGVDLIAWNCNSSQSLQLLKEKRAHIAGCHLVDETGQQDLRAIHAMFRPVEVTVVTFAIWEQGIVVAQGNPSGIRQIGDLADPAINIQNREPGSGSRILLDRLLKKAGIPVRLVAGYDSLADGHMAAARAVSRGEANCCIATRAAARAFSLDFIPLVHERYDFVIPKKMLREAGVESCLNLLNRASLRRELGTFAGYETTPMGQTV